MKFGRAFQEALQQDEFPPEWINSAIQYRQLKKCIKLVQNELTSLGLTPATLLQLRNAGLQENGVEGGVRKDEHMEYIFEGRKARFEPKLRLVIDESKGLPLEIGLSPETREFLQNLSPSRESGQMDFAIGDESVREICENGAQQLALSERRPSLVNVTSDKSSSARILEVALTADADFFRMLQVELSSIRDIETKEETHLKDAITKLGQEIHKMAEPRPGVICKADMYAWRELFCLYVDSKIFFSTSERDANKQRTAETAHKQLQAFISQLKDTGLTKRLKYPSGQHALNAFIGLNVSLLKVLRYQELNVQALTKILKKFDKRTALSAAQSFPSMVVADTFSPVTIAKSICFEVNNNLVSIIPQLDDYICPICCEIAWRPVRLECKHVFCIRCMITLQKSKTEYCPMCRGKRVMAADSTSLDPALAAFLKRYFPEEVKAKQKQNEHDAGVDQYGKGYDDKCLVM